MLYEDPDRTMYEEAAFGIGCSYDGKPGVYFPVMWVNKDWSLVRGWLNGYAKRIADKIALTRIHPANPIVSSVGAGSVLSGYCVAYGKKALSLRVRVERQGEKADLVSFGATYGFRRFPATDPSQNKVGELVEVLRYNNRSADVWVGVGEVAFDADELIGKIRVVRGVYYKGGFSIKGAQALSKEP